MILNVSLKSSTELTKYYLAIIQGIKVHRKYIKGELENNCSIFDKLLRGAISKQQLLQDTFLIEAFNKIDKELNNIIKDTDTIIGIC